MNFIKGKLRFLGFFHFLALSSYSPLYADSNEKLNFEASLFSEVEWNLEDRAAWMNEAAFYAVWKPVSPVFFELGTLHTYGLGDDVVIDDLQGFSNIKNDNMAVGLRMLDFGYETTFGSDNSHCLKLISGVRNVNEDYFTEGSAVLFLNGSDGIFPSVAANSELANFPLSGVCPIHAVYAHNKGFKAQFSLYNGVAGELADGSTFRFRPRRDGVTALGEVAYLRPEAPRYMLYSVGFVSNNTPEADASGESSRKVRSAWFSLVEQGLLKTDRYSLNLMLQGSSSLNSGSECKGYFGSGLVLNRNSGENKIWLESLGLMNHYAKYSEAEECNQELTLQLNLYDLFLLKPSLQLVEGHGDVQKVFVLRLCYEIK